MNQVFFFTIILFAVVLANVLNRHIKFIPLPFFLIGLGIVLTIVPSYRNFAFDPSVFSFAIIAPLLFNEGQNASRLWIGRTLGNIVSLAIGLVLVTIIALGITVHWLFPIIPLALAFAVIAIVSPTDASAVNAVNESTPLAPEQMLILSNESLFNDAAGIVAFDLALTAYISGSFSATGAAVDFLYVFFGGILVGAVLGTLIVSLRAWLIRMGDDEPIIMVTLQLVTPLLVYFIADELELSGILAVVAAGIAQGVERDRLRLTSARMQMVTTNVWEMLSGILSGLVFVLLGIALPNVITSSLKSATGFGTLVLIGVVIYALKFLLRFVWSRFLVRVPNTKNRLNDAAIIALSGASGTITLSLAFSMPTSMNSSLRQALILIAAVVIIISLVLPPLLMPLLLPKPPVQKNGQHVWVRRMLSAGIDAVRANTTNRAEAQVVADTLSQQLILDDAPSRRHQRVLFRQTIDVEKATIEAMRKAKTITDDEAYYYNRFIDLNDFTADQRIWKNLWLRTRFTFHMGSMYKDFSEAQNAFLTTPINLEPIFWKRQFKAHNEDIIPIEQAGFDAVMDQLNKLESNANRSEINNIRRFYRDRHRRIKVDAVDGDIIYQLFLDAFHAEYTFVQNALSQGQIPSDLAERLQQRITFDELTYLQNRESFQV
ncbi:cation:proton antiporter [Lacticaseibacillus saniviri]|uniref:NhaP-type Na H and K H antiporter n=1 Tax=Lacticaseibacillus saniviri JCM 17471 = DSM 24301 TaxID=1293598 RepID=A0A0R2MPM9_9LACO|nr:sodium:proton antiporter [Lacticaseibacillus saniviri]KRO15542.1 NhaP-type Na H and K H antiporter [Lacticaseibacillus saniviri JCM 17471 = DSM 24301]MCG4281636.1 sodium:proton antiporter [Lacticaseibacillus saniviri]